MPRSIIPHPFEKPQLVMVITQQAFFRHCSMGLAALVLSIPPAVALDEKPFGPEINNPQQVMRTWIWDGTELDPTDNEVMFGADTDPWLVTLQTELSEQQRLSIKVEVISRDSRRPVVFQEEITDIDPSQDQKFGFFDRRSQLRMSVHYRYIGDGTAPKGEITVLGLKPVSLKKE